MEDIIQYGNIKSYFPPGHLWHVVTAKEDWRYPRAIMCQRTAGAIHQAKH